MTWIYRTVLNVCMTLIAWAIDRKLQSGREPQGKTKKPARHA
jgi:hypothetical protein